ncbi:HEAT repeat domain-containing protein [bacterium]|nr:HEAT repeat domain-containing protein [bacterium]MCB9477252.1 HEAT repeat domain-containing protein [Deltaproteobacteria bacterium]
MARYRLLDYEELSPSIRQAIPTDASPEKRLAVARGLVPMGTPDLLAALYYLAGDEDKRVRREAQKSLKDLPETLVFVGITHQSSPKLLDYLAAQKFDNHHVYEKISLHSNVEHATLAAMAAANPHEGVLEIIGKNEKAILESPAILAGLVSNPKTRRSLIDRLTVFYETTKGHPFEEDVAPSDVPLPEDDEALEEESAEDLADPMRFVPDDRLHPCFNIADLMNPEFDAPELFASDLIDDPENVGEAEKTSMMKRILSMNFVDRLLLALKGNSEARRILIKSPSKTIQDCVMRNNKLTTNEIRDFARERSSSQNVIEAICRNREWTSNYEILNALCWHPKTPRAHVARLIQRLQLRDLLQLTRSKMVPAQTASQARALLLRRGGQR